MLACGDRYAPDQFEGIAELNAEGAEVPVVELADGIFQEDTAALLRSSRIRDRFAGVLFAQSDVYDLERLHRGLRLWPAPRSEIGKTSARPHP